MKTPLQELVDFIMTGQSLAEQGDCLMPNVTDVLNEIERLKGNEERVITRAYLEGAKAENKLQTSRNAPLPSPTKYYNETFKTMHT